jgi:hypothetical protein
MIYGDDGDDDDDDDDDAFLEGGRSSIACYRSGNVHYQGTQQKNYAKNSLHYLLLEGLERFLEEMALATEMEQQGLQIQPRRLKQVDF